jgi:hypothetical protein
MAACATKIVSTAPRRASRLSLWGGVSVMRQRMSLHHMSIWVSVCVCAVGPSACVNVMLVWSRVPWLQVCMCQCVLQPCTTAQLAPPPPPAHLGSKKTTKPNQVDAISGRIAVMIHCV